jgi:hypothetical protein
VGTKPILACGTGIDLPMDRAASKQAFASGLRAERQISTAETTPNNASPRAFRPICFERLLEPAKATPAMPGSAQLASPNPLKRLRQLQPSHSSSADPERRRMALPHLSRRHLAAHQNAAALHF